MSSNLVLEIQNILANPQTPIELLSEIAAEYDESCTSANERLSRVRKLLATGHRDEGVQLAERFPPVLDTVADLDFPEIDQWRNTLLERGLAPPPVLSFDAAAQVENAYDKLRKYESLLETHRMLALSQSPLPARILVLKKLAEKDPANPIWVNDIETFERTRLDQIESELARARKRNDLPQLQALSNELQGPWSIRIPKRLQASVAQKSTALAQEKAKVEMEPIAEKLTQCLVEFDSETALPLRDQWNSLNGVAKLQPDDPLQKTAEEPLAWLADLDVEQRSENDFELAVGGLENAIDQRSSLEVLESKIFRVEKFGRGIPESLSHRASVYQEDLRVAQTRKTKLRFFVIAAILLATAGIVFSIVQTQAARHELSQSRQQMEKFVSEDSYAAGKRYFESLDLSLQADGEIITSHSLLLENEKAELDRVKSFKSLIEGFDLTGPLERRLDGVLEEASKLAKTGTEKDKVSVLKNNLVKARLERQGKRKADFDAKLRTLMESVKVAAGNVEQLKALELDLKKLSATSTLSIDGLPYVSRPSADNVRNLLKRVKSKLEFLEKADAAEVRLDGLAKGLGVPDQFAEDLDEFAQEFPANVNSPEFLEAIQEKGAWISFAKWRRAASQFRMALKEGALLQEEAEAWSNRLKEITRELTITGFETSLESTEKFLKKKPKPRSEFDQDLVERTMSVLEKFKYSEIQYVQRDNRTFYLTEIPPNGAPTFKYFTTVASGINRTRFNKGEVAKNAPHCSHAKLLRAELKNSKGRSVSDMAGAMLKIALAPSKDVNQPIESMVQCEFVDQILLLVEYSAPALKELAKSERDRLKRLEVVGGDWKFMAEQKLPTLRPRAAKEVSSFQEKWNKGVADLAPPKMNLAAMMKWTELSEYEAIGFLRRKNGDLKIPFMKQPPKGALLYVIVPSANNEADFKAIGNFDNGVLTNAPDKNLLIAGRPVYYKHTPPK